MGSKGSKPATQTTSQTQSYTANPLIAGAAGDAISRAQSAASQPFQMPVAPVAGFNPMQQQSFQQILDMQGQFNPYGQAASQYWQNSAAPITGADVNQYYNPMADNVFANLQNAQRQQFTDTTGKLTQAAGGVGASRIAVGQAELAKQQNLATGQVASGLWQQALGAAQAQKQMQAGAGMGMLNTGNAIQNAGTRDIALLGQGGLQQQQQAQAQLNAPYQNELARIAYPFQTAQYLAGITSGLSGSLGGTTTGQSQTQYQPAQPSGWAQGIGLGMQGLGMLMGMPTIPGMGMGKGSQGTPGIGPGMGQPYVMYSARGGAITHKAEGGGVADQQSPWAIKSNVPSMQLKPTSGRSAGDPMVGAMKLEHAKQPEGQAAPSTAQAASGVLDQLSNLVKNQQEYEPDDHADGGAVFPKHFYDGGATWGLEDSKPPNPFANLSMESLFGPRSAWEKPTAAPNAQEFGPEASTGYAEAPLPDNAFPAPQTPTPAPAPAALPQTLNVLPKPRDLAVIGKMEGGNRGYETTVDTGKGFDVLGQYGISERNLPEWGQKYVGRPVTREEFLANPRIQDAIASGEFGRLRSLYGPEGAAQRWLTGEFGNPQSRDRFGTSGLDHGQKFAALSADLGASTGTPSGGVEVGAARSPFPSAQRGPTEGYYAMPRSRMPYPDSLNRDWGQQATRSPWMSLVKAGAVTASNPGPLGAAIAKGIGAGADHLTAERGQRRSEESVNQRAQQLHQAAQHYFDQYNKMTPYHEELIKSRNSALASRTFPGKGMVDGKEVDGLYKYNPEINDFEFQPGVVATGKPGGKSGSDGGVFEFKRKAYLAVNPGDEKGALDFANGRKTMSPADIMKFATAQAEAELKNSTIPITDPKRREVEKGRIIQRIVDSFNGAAPAAAPAAKPALTPEQEGALKFIQENPNDPRTPAIKQKLKEQGIE